MGIDWYPCRLDAGVEKESLEDAIRDNHRSFLIEQNYPKLVPFFESFQHDGSTDSDEVALPDDPQDLLLMKFVSHRVTVICNNPIFPAEWRVDAYRTFAPWELPAAVTKWKRHSQEIRAGQHRAYLYEWFLYESNVDLTKGYQTLKSLADSNETEDAQWTQNPELDKVRKEIQAIDVPAPLPPPRWAHWASRPNDLADEGNDVRELELLNQFRALEELNGRWNRYGRNRMQPLSSYLSFDWKEQDYSKRSQDWLQEFFAWVDPLVQQEYGLYRDC